MHTWTDSSEKFLETCIEALGGISALYGVKSIKVCIERHTYSPEQTEPTTSFLTTFRAVGGRIRLEERFPTKTLTIVTIINGLAGHKLIYSTSQEFLPDLNPSSVEELNPCEIETIKRTIRLYPRNFLAHADEHQYTAPQAEQEHGHAVYCLELPAEEVRFCFDAETFLCRSATDGTCGMVTGYEDYRSDTVLTPFVERRWLNQCLYQEDFIQSVEYNLPLDETLFLINRES